MYIRTQKWKENKYRIYSNNNGMIVVAVSSFAGKPIRGIARCDSTNPIKLEKSIELAILRCNKNIAIKKMIKSVQVARAACAQYDDAMNNLRDAKSYLLNGKEKVIDAAK